MEPKNQDYDLQHPIVSASGLRQGLTSYGNAHFFLLLGKTQLMDAAEQGIHLQGGIAIDFPTISLHESFSHPTSMFLRNFMKRDKTLPAQIMGGLSANKPILPLITGPIMPGGYQRKRIGACTDCQNNWASFRAGKMDLEEIMAINEELAPTPLHPSSSLIVVHRNIAPNGAVIKASASKDTRLLCHTGPAGVFDNPRDLALRLDDPNLEVTADSVLVLKGIGPVGNPGMPEAGRIPIPRKLAPQGVTVMLRISDGRLSGTAGGTIVLHISPESAMVESRFGVVQTGDTVALNAQNCILWVEVEESEFQGTNVAEKASRGGRCGGKETSTRVSGTV
ncbi:dihydroxy-acid and 6-phosphogluconate dehydratase [Penicillium capsulatum]|uniref:Dihydroxy-acid and 6-phosphogluconate dehydratase n=1 Tax=Penicillium capsulatum TaxID=69766 RepID=A0A9W9HYF7_9EURO|nr:dihydroxy-acid and 6-phosphogluconate dehydratase [Penicillium capsulatum]KAJ6116551.1 dihydroxy-acid and 6-phosphogluconate dehydratase [Penicillium capsulatum]